MTRPVTHRSRGAQIKALLIAWLTIDFFGKSRRGGKTGSGTLTVVIFTQGSLSYAFALLNFPPDLTSLAFAAGTFAVVSGFTMLAMLGELNDQLGHPADRDFVQACPLSRSTFLLARGVHVLVYLGLFNFGMAIAPAVLSTWTTATILAPLWYVLLSLLLSVTLVSVVQAPIVVVDRILGHQAATTLAVLTRATLMGGIFLGLVLGLRALAQGPEAFPGGFAVLRLLPPYWFAHAHEAFCGRGTADPGYVLAALLAAPIAALTLFLAALLPTRSRPHRRRRSEPLVALLRPAVRSPAELGMVAFVLKMLARERSFRLRALPLLGLPLAIVVLGLMTGIEDQELPLFLAVVHNLPLVYLPFLIVFLPYAEGFESAWLIESSVADAPRMGRRAVVWAFGLLLLFVQLVLLAVDGWHRGALAALTTTGAALGMAWILLPILTRNLQGACFSVDPEEFTPPTGMGGILGLGIVVTLVAAGLEALPAPALSMVALALLGLGIYSLIRAEQEGGT